MPTEKRSFWMTPSGLAALGLIGAVTYFLLMEHRQHLFAALPFLTLLACPLMHFFMHGNHGVQELLQSLVALEEGAVMSMVDGANRLEDI